MNINEIKAQEAKENERRNHMSAKERLERFNLNLCVNGECLEDACPYCTMEGSCNANIKDDINTILIDSDLQEQYVKHLEQAKENMKKITNILCDTISQLI